MPLNGKRVFITGGTGGIGRPLVGLLYDAGASLLVYESRRHGDLIANIETVCNWLRHNPPDILINMAGINAVDYCEHQDLETLVALNLLVPMRLTQAVLPGMKARGSGQIVQMGSMTALIPLPHQTGYVAAKAGLKGFNDALRRELGGTDIALTHVVPRAVQTPMNNGAGNEINRRTGVRADDPMIVSKRILKAIINREKEVRFGWPERLFAFLNANFSLVIDMGLKKNRTVGEQVLNGVGNDVYGRRQSTQGTVPAIAGGLMPRPLQS